MCVSSDGVVGIRCVCISSNTMLGICCSTIVLMTRLAVLVVWSRLLAYSSSLGVVALANLIGSGVRGESVWVLRFDSTSAVENA